MNKIILYLFFLCGTATFFSCQKEYSVDSYLLGKGAGSLWDSAGDCLFDTIHGTFYNGVIAGSDTAYVEVEVNVTRTGNFSITSDVQNGFQFIDSGFFSTTGLTRIRLKSIGAAIIPAPTTFNISLDSSFCSFTINVQDSTGTGLGGQPNPGGGSTNYGSGNFQFTQGSTTYAGTIDTALQDNSGGSATLLQLIGFTAGKDTSFITAFAILSPQIQVGTYTTSTNGLIFSFDDLPNDENIFLADPIDAGTGITLNIVSYDAVTKEMKATFSGTVVDATETNKVPITNGTIDVFFP